MLKIYGSSIYKPLEIILKQCIETAVFPSEWKKADIAPIHKEGDKQTLKNYRSVSLLPICAKILEGLLFNKIFIFLLKIHVFDQICPVLHMVIFVLISCYLSLIRYINLLMKGLKLEASSLISHKGVL